MKLKPAQISKALVAAATAVTEAIALGLLDGAAEKWALVALAAAGTYGVFAVPNKPAA